MAFLKIPRTEENLRLAEAELNQNTLNLTEDRISEERKTLLWVREQIRNDQ